MRDDVAGIGVGVPSVIDLKTGTVYDVQNIPSWKEVPLKARLEERYGRPAYVNNDANCFAVGEKYFGKIKPYDSAVGLIVGTGLGAGIIANGRLYSGVNCGAGEFGMIPYLDRTLEDYASGRFFKRVHGVGPRACRTGGTRRPGPLAIFAEFGRHLGEAVKVVLLRRRSGDHRPRRFGQQVLPVLPDRPQADVRDLCLFDRQGAAEDRGLGGRERRPSSAPRRSISTPRARRCRHDRGEEHRDPGRRRGPLGGGAGPGPEALRDRRLLRSPVRGPGPHGGGRRPLRDRPDLGFSLDVAVRPNAWVEISYSRQDTTVDFLPLAGESVPLFDALVEFFQFGGAYEAGGQVSPYALATIGLATMKPRADGVENEVKFAAALGGGLKIYLARRLGVRLQGRLLFPVLSAGGAFFVGPGGGYVIVSSSVLVWGDLSAGLFLRF